MDFVLGVLFGGAAMILVVMFSLARSAKEADEVENRILSEKIARIKAQSNEIDE